MPSAADVEAWAAACDIRASERRALLQLQAEGLAQQRHFRGRVDQGEHQQDYALTHARASTVIEYSTYIVPGCVQIESYAAAVLKAWGRVLSTEGTEADGAAARADRARHVHDPNKTHRFILAESAIRWHYGGPAVMAAQLDWIAKLAELETVEFRIIPFGEIDIPIGVGFVAFDDLVVVESWTGTTEGSLTDEYGAVVKLLDEASLRPDESLEVIRAEAARL